MLTGRQIQLLEQIRNQPDFITIAQTAGLLGVSAKTVRNDLAAIKEYLQTQNLGEVITKPHAGIQAKIDDIQWEQIMNSVEQEDGNEFLENAPDTMIWILLKKRKLSFSEAEKRLYLSRSAIEKELPKVKDWFRDHQIVFEKKRGKGMEITCTEFQWRIALWRFYSRSHFPEPGSFLDGFDYAGVEMAVSRLEEEQGLFFSYEGHMQMVFLLSLSVMGVRRGVDFQMQKSKSGKSPYEERLVKKLAVELETAYGVHFGSQERAFILFLVRISDIQRFAGTKPMQYYQSQNMELCIITMKLVHLLGEIVNLDLRTDMFFVESMLLQLRSAIARMKYRIYWKHPLIHQVKKKYPNIFAAAYAAGVFFDKELGLELNENEMCGIALLLGGAIERSTTVLTACVVCNYGIGVSQLLRERIERNISDLKILEVLSARDIRRVRKLKADLVISTIPLEGVKNLLIVEHLLPAHDIRAIEDRMKQIRKENLKKKSSCKTLKLQQKLFVPDFIWVKDSASSKEQLLGKMCRKLADFGYVTEKFEASVFEHEEHAPTELGSQVALPHGYARCVIRPVVAFASLAKPVIWQENKWVDLVFMLAFNLDEATGMKAESIKFYGVFLDLLEDEKELQKLREIEESVKLANYMNQKIRGGGE